ncbi:MAG: DUF3034 family protein [Terracidiphilus sp.]|nr:DUF3034 family protein [Terracidiphilus sp.]
MRNRVFASLSSVFASRWTAAVIFAALLIVARGASAQSLGYEGPTGVFVTPLAATAASPAHGAGHPVIAYHLLAGGPVIGTWNTVSITEGFAQHIEVGYTREDHAAGNTAGLSPLWRSGLNIFHGKVNVVPENAGKTKWVPAISVGGIARTNDTDVYDGQNGQSKTNGDIYLVATKVITQIDKKVPVLVNAGVRGTNASLWGLGGNAPDFTARGFGALAFVFKGPAKGTVILASEVAQQPQRIKYTSTAGVASPVLDIPTSIDYAVRYVPSPKHKLNIDFGILQAAGRIAPGVDLKARARAAFGISYGF